ncbi:MAG TPA: Gldg family protein [Puia sp.]|uniref:Gldg family protein n=1 Tax=Puia sp. TaxID=2045100 RepID=UPI002BDD8BB9|nr:Gldg family protein [Puia sp.]HVU94349.1 Gldg family protein [Puia sp.]
MKMIFKIARTELRNLYYSPVAWFLTIAFLVQSAIYYTGILYGVANWQDIQVRNNPRFKDWGVSLTPSIFFNPDSIFTNALNNLFLYIPLLTMGLISREINNGTIKLLYSSPVKVREIVWGKYLAIMIYNLVLVSVLGIFMVSAAFNIRSVDYGMLLSATLGFYLMLSAFTAIGFFLSSLSTYQIVSAIGSFILIFVLSRIGGLWQKIDFVRDLTYFLAVSGRTEKMLRGLITTKDVIYFLLIVYLFLSFTYFKLIGGRESRPWFVHAGRYTMAFAFVLIIGYISSRPALTGYWDTTAGKVNTIHERTQKIVRELGPDPLEVTLYTNLLGNGAGRGFPEARNRYLTELWEQYVRFKPDIRFNYVNYYDYDSTIQGNDLYRSFPGKTLKEIAVQMAGGFEYDPSLFAPPAEVARQADLRPENLRLVMQLTYKGRTTFLRTFDDAVFWPDEQQVAAAFKRLMQARLPKIYYVTGDLERSIFKKGEREFRLHSTEKLSRLALVNQGFDADTLSLDTRDIPADATALVLADPKTNLSALAMSKLRQYVDKGGNLLVLGEPGKQALVNPLLQQCGVRLMDGTLVHPTRDEVPDKLVPYVTDAGLDLAEEDQFLGLKALHADHDYDDSLKWLMPGAAALAYAAGGAFTVKPLLMMPERGTWQKAGRLVDDSADIVFSPQEGDIAGAFPVALGLTRPINGREQRIVICGDADCMSTIRAGGFIVTRAIFSWLDNGKFPIYTPRPTPRDSRLIITGATANVLKTVYVWILPSLLLLLGTLLLIRRKRK